ncbi:MAG: phage holin family protein [Oscillatoriales cyanobacterium RM2_1_1]|nr:phage holin family protein [Oscillatoriales cyanobacterium SM2_3_0]NJO47145.1 phage holin family protein [Oscillatoriales cyanobacterium RM2_1_1]
MVPFLISIVVTAISLLIISKIPPIGVEVDNPVKALMGGAIIGAFSGLWSLFPNFFKTFTAVISLGLIPLLGSIIVFGISAYAVEGFRLRYGIWSAILGAIALALVNSIVFFILRSIGLVGAAV